MVTEEENLVGADRTVTPPLEPKVPEEPQEPKEPKEEESPEVKAKAEHLANIKVAIAEANEELRKKRDLLKEVSPSKEELPQIDLNDPSAKAWDKRIQDAAAPAQKELNKAKEERRMFALRQFLSDKPALAKNPEKVKAMMETYDRLKTSTELTSEGIMMDLEKSYAAEHSEELINLARQQRTDTARDDVIFSDPAVTRGSTAYSKEQPKERKYTEEEKNILSKWNMTPQEHATMDAEMKKKAQVG